MARAHQREAWQHTAWIAAMIANANRDPRKKPSPFTPDDFNPTVERKSKNAGTVVTVGRLKDVIEKKGQVS
jgi:hypothetical protein